MRRIKQSTYETCLSCCLLMAMDKSAKDEIEIWKHGWKFNYLIGQLNYVAKKYNKNITVYIEYKSYFNYLRKQKQKGIELINKKIDLKLLYKLLETQKVIIYLDGYYPYKPNSRYVHASHFVIALGKKGDFIEVSDPWDGKIKKWSINEVKKGIISLRNHLKYSPVLITIPAERDED